MDAIARRLERRGDRARHVLDVDQRPPRRAVALEPYRARRQRPPDEVVENDVETEAWRDAVGGREPQRHRRELVAREGCQRALAAHLRLGIGREGCKRRGLVDREPGARGAVHAAGRREHEPRDSTGPSQLGEPGGRLVVDGVRQSLVELPDRVVREGREVDNGIEAVNVLFPHVTDVQPNLRRWRRDSEVAALVQRRVETDHVVAGRLEHGPRDRAHVPAAPRQQNPHGLILVRTPQMRTPVRRSYPNRPSRTHALWPPRPIAFESATSTST